ncbi:tetratricopeptide repeat protein [Coraliomargarita parva]|uniref:tetratricopeptide repeat protein n=1 Tax=Coraliomargarita parva TaxID=3014050 RepID=UPI0022B33659|nr:tetratricopeptide repeat protein [Coraliomargarita parva]
MQEIPLKDLDNRLQKQIENARKAVDKNPAYAVDILMNIVKRHPECLEARKILRQAQSRASGGKSKGFGKFLTKVTSIPFSIGSEAKVKKDPAKALESAEDMLKADPSNPVGHKILGIAAEALELNETAAYAYEELYKIDDGNMDNVKLLMGAYIRIGKTEDAIRLGDTAYRRDPSDDEIQGLIKKASVEQSIEKGKWEEEKSFREKLKDEEEAQKLEQASRARTGEAGLRSLIADALKAVEAEPDNINFYRELSSHYRKLGEFDSALEWIEKARQLESGRADVNLERMAGALKREKMQKAIADAEAELEATPGDAALEAKLKELQAEERSFRLEQAELLVQRYPNEFSYRFELGELYFEDGETDKAIKELQLALRAPKVRINSLILLGKAYKAKGFHDLAAEQLTTAKAEIPGVTEQKKDVLYELGECYESQGDMDKAMVEFKALYGADISYRDVAQKIDDFYSKKNAS